MKYRDYNDNELLEYISENNEEASNIMFDKYNPLIVNIANHLLKNAVNLGLDKNDLIQEGLLGLHAAINTYDENKDISFYTYARKCIQSRMISLIVSNKRQKHRVLNESISLNDKFSEESLEFLDYLGDNSYNPEFRYIEKEKEEELINKFSKTLTEFEEEVFMLKIGGLNYKEISKILDKDIKAIDNALQRIRVKLKNHLNEKLDK